MMKTNLYAYDNILLEDIHWDKEPDYIYANPTIYDMENNYKVVINEENSQLELIDSSSGLFESIYVCNDTELISHIENILEFYIKNKEHEAKAKAFDSIAVNIKALRKHMLNSGKSVNAKIIETDNTIKHIEAIIERADTYV